MRIKGRLSCVLVDGGNARGCPVILGRLARLLCCPMCLILVYLLGPGVDDVIEGFRVHIHGVDRCEVVVVIEGLTAQVCNILSACLCLFVFKHQSLRDEASRGRVEEVACI